VAFGDAQGQVHLLSREQGSTLQRLATDGTPVALQPVVAGRYPGHCQPQWITDCP